jgi:hypothetical protein
MAMPMGGGRLRTGIATRRTTAVWSLTQAFAVIGGTVLVFSLPAIGEVFSDPASPYGFLAADAFYYFTIAANWTDFGTPSFDQVHPTNGFHPLWQWLTALTYAALKALGFTRFALVPVTVVAGLLLLSGAIVLLGLVHVKKGRISPLFALLPLGAWPLMISPLWWSAREQLPAYRMIPLFGTLWNFANGLESALLLLIFSIVTWCYVKRPVDGRGRALGFGALLGALSLARLDHAVFALTLAGLPFAYHLAKGHRQRAWLGAWTLLAWISILAVYLAYNAVVVGRLMPVSGAVKSTFPDVNLGNLRWLSAFPTLNPRQLMFGLGRIGSITFPAVIALFYFPFALRIDSSFRRASPVLREGHGRLSELMSFTAIGMLALAAYDTLFVVEQQIGEWYAPVSVLFVTLFAVQVAERVAERWPLPAGRWLGWGLFLALSALEIESFRMLHRVAIWGADYADFCLSRSPKVVEHYAGAPPKLLSRDDGVVGFATGFPTTSGSRVALDAEAAEASAAGRFEQLLAERGVDRVTSQHYLHTRGFRVGERSRRVQKYAGDVLMDTASRTYEVEYVDRDFGIVRAR